MNENIGKNVNFVYDFYGQIDIRYFIFGAFEMCLDESSIVIANQSYADDKCATPVMTTHAN